MAEIHDPRTAHERVVDFDLHGLVGVRLINPDSGDVAAVARNLGNLKSPLKHEPDITLRFSASLATQGLNYLGAQEAGFTRDGFYILRSSKRACKVKIDFTQIGEHVDLLCEHGLRAIPLLLPMVMLRLLRKGYVGVHASAFHFQKAGILVTGWSKGGKSEALLAFARYGARYLGDEWIILSPDGERMFGIPENMRLWDWHLAQLPDGKHLLNREKRFLFKIIKFLDSTRRSLSRGPLRNTLPVRYLREMMPALNRQRNITQRPQAIFGESVGPLVGRPDRVFLLVSHAAPEIRIEQAESDEVIGRMLASTEYELQPLRQMYLAFRYAFPEKRNAFLEQAPQLRENLLRRALAGKKAFRVLHPYPCNLESLYEEMLPFCEEAGSPPAPRHTRTGAAAETAALAAR